MTTRAFVESAVDLSRLCESLRRADPDIVEIVLFGSAAYAPDLAQDVDVVITTRVKKDDDVYRDAVAEFDARVDVLVREPGQPMGRDVALGVYAVGRTLFGDHVTVKEARRHMAVPTYEGARELLLDADRDLDLAHEATKEFRRDTRYRKAFDALFDAARYAAMTFLSTDNSRWGELPRRLPRPVGQRFREFIATLHVQYHYDGHYPKDAPDEEYTRWRDTVRRFIEDLENASPTQTDQTQESL